MGRATLAAGRSNVEDGDVTAVEEVSMKGLKTWALALGVALVVGGAMLGLVFAIDRAVTSPAAAGVAILFGATAVAFVAYVATGVRNAVAWRRETSAMERQVRLLPMLPDTALPAAAIELQPTRHIA
jgi:hypothetical protein